MIYADLYIRNADIHTFDPQTPRAEALAVKNGVILATGREADLAGLAGPETRVVDLQGKTVLPGFIDAHEHMSWFAENSLKLILSADRVNSIAQIMDLVASEAKSLPTSDWIRGTGYDDTKMAEGRRLTRTDLDRAAPDHPVIVVHISGHWAVVNSKALQLGGLDETSRDPEGGSLGRDPESGRLDGRLLETAMFNFAFESLTVTPTVVPPFDREVRRKAVREAAAFLNTAGITGVGDALCAPSYVTTYLELAREKQLSVRVNMMVPYIFLDKIEGAGLIGGWGDHWARSSGIKILLDGAISGKTAAMQDGFADDPDDHGLLLLDDQDQINALVARIHDLDFQACIHANGDMAINMALDAIEKAMQANPRPDPRHRIEHCTMIDADILSRMSRLGVAALPFTSYIWQHAEKLGPYYGSRAPRMFAHNSFIKAGILTASGSDHPVGLHTPLLGIQCMTTRRSPTGEVIGPEEKISLDDAIKVYTVNAARASREENIKGSLTPGLLADMAVLGRDPWKTPADEISRIPVDMTIVHEPDRSRRSIMTPSPRPGRPEGLKYNRPC